jgi:hypothetical protein
MEASRQPQTLAALPQGKGPPYSLDRRLSGPPELVWTLFREEKFLAYVENPTQTFQLIAHHYTD